ncbi:MAG: hypothetical protein NWE98_03990 [Candidatus Bathyarchaeota archaeon]|nr:hypothetical protein [Candidatus Bathyarchaeota archaeon]
MHNYRGKKELLNSKKRISIVVAHPYLEGMELLIKDGLYENQAEILKDALRRLFNHYEITSISDACTAKN